MIETWVEMMDCHKSERKAAFSDLAERGMTVEWEEYDEAIKLHEPPR